MTIDRDNLRADIELGKRLTGTYQADSDRDYYPAMKRIFDTVPSLLDALDAAEAENKRLAWKVGNLQDIYNNDMEEIRQEVDEADKLVENWKKQYKNDTDYWMSTTYTAENLLFAVADVLASSSGNPSQTIAEIIRVLEG